MKPKTIFDSHLKNALMMYMQSYKHPKNFKYSNVLYFLIRNRSESGLRHGLKKNYFDLQLNIDLNHWLSIKTNHVLQEQKYCPRLPILLAFCLSTFDWRVLQAVSSQNSRTSVVKTRPEWIQRPVNPQATQSSFGPSDSLHGYSSWIANKKQTQRSPRISKNINSVPPAQSPHLAITNQVLYPA